MQSNCTNCCRACLKISDESVPLFGSKSLTKHNLEIAQIFMDSVSIGVSINDQLPQSLCRGCFSKLIDSFNFKDLCRKSDDILRIKPFSDIQEKRVPKEEKTNKTEPKSCKTCGKTFTSAATLKLHNRCHTGEKPYLCSVCGKSFSRSVYLTTHMRSHTEQRPHVCQHCGKCFKHGGDLKVHIRIHTGERSCVCNLCEKTFVTVSSLRRHLRLHSGDRPFKCKVCQKSFSESCALVKHIRIHTGDKPYQCNVCGKAFNQSTTLNKHLKLHRNKSAINVVT